MVSLPSVSSVVSLSSTGESCFFVSPGTLPKKIAIGCRNETFSQMIFTITVVGTASRNPENPQMPPQIDRLTRIMNGESPRFEPVILGSRMLPSVNCVIAIMSVTITILEISG